MLSIVFNLEYLSQNFIKFNIQGVFWNPQDEQISKLTLVIKFDQDLMEKKRKTSWLILTDTGCIFYASCVLLHPLKRAQKHIRFIEVF